LKWQHSVSGSAEVRLEAVIPRVLGVLLVVGLAVVPRLAEAGHDLPYRPSEGVVQDLLDVGKLAGSGFLLQFAGVESLALMGLTAIVASVSGIWISYKADLPTGAAIVCTLGAAPLLVGFVSKFLRKPDAASSAKLDAK